ncbi:MAG: N-6 DNA methylase [Bowdeniella nasicola]|nr:N-6 DNA methylase [Bowdeniella nasicola]
MTTIHVVGDVLPGHFLTSLAAGQLGAADTHRPASYDFPGGLSINNIAEASWRFLQASWREFHTAQGRTPGGMEAESTSPAVLAWVERLCYELGYGVLKDTGGGLVAGDATYPISHRGAHTPVHVVGPGVDLDRAGDSAGLERAPQSMMQEYLNRSETDLWALLTNGRTLRLLRDSMALAGASYLEVDLAEMFETEQFSDFLLVFRLLHESRLRPQVGAAGEPNPELCHLERWRQSAIDVGMRAMGDLRVGVEQAIEALGSGFLTDPRVADALRTGELGLEDFQHELLRLVYRMLFVFVAEERGLLLDPEAPEQARERYEEFYSAKRLRIMARRRVGSAAYSDLYAAYRLVWESLGASGLPELGVPALGGLFEPFGPERDPAYTWELPNDAFLSAVRHLAWIGTGSRVEAVNYRNLGAEELGGVYEGLLELHPAVDWRHARFTLEQAAGNARKTTGSYYTPSTLVSQLLDTALDPVLDRAVAQARDGASAERALLDLTICDPACGSGHFLVAAARRIARRVAALRQGDDEPTPGQVRAALRDVVSRCLYGVDINPLAAELAKVSLWLEAMEPGKPLTFLDSHIRVGNSLLGITPDLVTSPIPDAAYRAWDGDDKALVRLLKKRNKSEAELAAREDEHEGLFALGDAASIQRAPDPAIRRTSIPETLDEVHAERRRWREARRSPEYRAAALQANAWLATFFWPFREGAAPAPTTAVIAELGVNEASQSEEFTTQVADIAERLQFFHFHLEFPEVFARGGFSAVLGNPPWEKAKFQEREFFESRAPEFAAMAGAKRKAAIAALEAGTPEEQGLYREFAEARERANRFLAVAKGGGLFPLTGTGDLNTYALFTELTTRLVSPNGRLGIIVPTGIATDKTTSAFFRSVTEARRVESLYDFENKGIFPEVHSSFKFCLLTVTGADQPVTAAHYAFFLHSVAEIADRAYALSAEEIALVNPNTGTLPIFRTRRDADITLGIYRRLPVLVREATDDRPEENPWGVRFSSMFHMTNDSHLFHTREELEADGWTLYGNVFARPLEGAEQGEPDSLSLSLSGATAGWERMMPLYEGKMFHHFDAAFATYLGDEVWRDMTWNEKTAHIPPQPRYWVHERDFAAVLKGGQRSGHGHIGMRTIARATDSRSLIASLLPRVPVGHSVSLIRLRVPGHSRRLNAWVSSFVLDYVARQKLGGSNASFFVLKQLPMPGPEALVAGLTFDRPIDSWLGLRVDRLNAWDISESPRAELRAELDAYAFHLYGCARDEVTHIMATFPGVRAHDLEAEGRYATRDRILAAYDAMSRAIGSGKPYQSPFEAPRPAAAPAGASTREDR